MTAENMNVAECKSSKNMSSIVNIPAYDDYGDTSKCGMVRSDV